MAYTQIDKIVKRKLTKTEAALLSTIARSDYGVGNEQIVSITTPNALHTHIKNLRDALTDGYQIKRSNNRYMLIEHDTQSPDAVEVTPVIVKVTPVTEPEPVAPVDHVAAIRSQLQTKLDELQHIRTQREISMQLLSNELDVLLAKIGDLENSLHVLTDHIALHLVS